MKIIQKTIISKVILTDEQKELNYKIREALRKTWNKAIELQKASYDKKEGYIKPNDLDTYFRKIKNKEGYEYIKECKCSARQHMLQDLDKAYKRFFEGKTNVPHFKSFRCPIMSIYLPHKKEKYGIDYINQYTFHIPYFKKVKLSRPISISDNCRILAGRLVTKVTGDVYLHILIELPAKNTTDLTEPIGIDLGVKKLATFNKPIKDFSFSNGKLEVSSYPKLNNINGHISHYENRIRRLNRAYSKKVEAHKKMYLDELTSLIMQKRSLDENIYRSKMRSIWYKTYHSKNMDKIILKKNKLYQKITNIRRDYERKIIASIINNRPSYIVIEDIDIKGLIENSPSNKITKSIYDSRWFYFREWLTKKCNEYSIELRIADRGFLSTQICSKCGHIHKHLKLTDRTYICEACGYTEDRDINAAINLVNTNNYDIA